MLTWELIDTAEVPNSATTMRLLRHGRDLVINVDERELMRSSVHGSEDALAQLTCARLVEAQHARVLIGGLGMGFTLAAALRSLGEEAQVVVAELVPAVVSWNRGVLGAAAGHPLDDTRAKVHQGDVAELLREPPQTWDAVMLDVDNGPVALTRSNNNWLYSAAGLQAAFGAIKPRGVLAVWSAAPDPAFSRRLERAGFAVECVETRARGRRGGRQHTIWLGTRKAEAVQWYETPF